MAKQEKLNNELIDFFRKIQWNDRESLASGYFARRIYKMVDDGADLEHCVCEYLDVITAKALSEDFIDFLFEDLEINATPRMAAYAFISNNQHLFDILCKRGFDFNKPDLGAEPPSVVAAGEGRLEMLKWIYENQGISRPQVAFAFATMCLHKETAEYVLSKVGKENMDLRGEKIKILPFLGLAKSVSGRLNNRTVYAQALGAAKTLIDFGANPYDESVNGYNIVNVSLHPSRAIVLNMIYPDAASIKNLQDFNRLSEEEKGFAQKICGPMFNFLDEVKDYYDAKTATKVSPTVSTDKSFN